MDKPDDEAKGGSVTFTFSKAATVHSLGFIDIEETGGTVKLTLSNGKTKSFDIPKKGDGKTFTLNLGSTAGVVKAKVTLKGSGAMDKLSFCLDGCKPDKKDC